MKPDEAAFESHIAEWLVDHGGYTAWKLGTQSTDFDPVRGLDTVELFAFIEETQPDEWAKVLTTHGGSSVAAEKAFLDRLTKELDSRGTVDWWTRTPASTSRWKAKRWSKWDSAR